MQFPPFVGYELRSWLLKKLKTVNPSLATEAHDSNAAPPYTVSTLMQQDRRVSELHPGQKYWIRITTLTEAVSAAVSEFLEHSDYIELNRKPLHIESVTTDSREMPLAGQTSYADLVALGQREPANAIEFTFTTPTGFKRNGNQYPLPDPRLIFQSYQAQWEACSDIALPAKLDYFASDAGIITDVQLQTHSVRIKQMRQADFVGFAGFLTLSLKKPKKANKHNPQFVKDYNEHVAALTTLAHYANYCGTGKKASWGYGQTRTQVHT